LYSTQQAANYLGISVDILYEMVKNRQISYSIKPSLKGRTQYQFDVRKLDEWIERHTISAVA
jgi:excisionase family DNA binding protein